MQKIKKQSSPQKTLENDLGRQYHEHNVWLGILKEFMNGPGNKHLGY